MPRRRRHIKANALYEISFRAVDTIPLVCTEYMKAIILSILARVQRDEKVILHHYVFEGSHSHLLCTAQDADQCRKFYGELKKQITEAVKRLMGIQRLRLWEDRPSVILIPTFEDAINKIVYMYANPSNDNLEDSIERYPGVTSWECFEAAMQRHEQMFVHERLRPWIRQRMIPRLPGQGEVTERQDRTFTARMLEKGRRRQHTLSVYPNAWVRSVARDVSIERVREANQEIVRKLRLKECENREVRRKSGKGVVGEYRLRTQPLLKPHAPKKIGRKVFVHTQFNDIRVEVIEEQKEVEARCREVYQRWRLGDFSVPWPAGTFPPPPPVRVNLLYQRY